MRAADASSEPLASRTSASPGQPVKGRPASAARSFYKTRRPRGRRSVKGRPACERRAVPLEEGPSLARTRTVPRSMTSRLRDDSQRTVAHPSPDDRGGSRTTQTFSRSYMLEQQLKNEDNETIGTLSRAIKGARLRKWEISQECFNLVCRALQIPWHTRQTQPPEQLAAISWCRSHA